MISERYTRWVAMLAQSDANLVVLAAIAVVCVALWMLSVRLPERWREAARTVFICITIYAVIQIVFPPHLTWLVTILVGLLMSPIVLVLSQWLAKRKAKAKQ